jgi:hypothetical protein
MKKKKELNKNFFRACMVKVGIRFCQRADSSRGSGYVRGSVQVWVRVRVRFRIRVRVRARVEVVRVHRHGKSTGDDGVLIVIAEVQNAVGPLKDTATVALTVDVIPNEHSSGGVRNPTKS